MEQYRLLLSLLSQPAEHLTKKIIAAPPVSASKPKKNRNHLRHLSIFYDKPDADESDVKALMSVRSMKIGIVAVKYSWNKVSQARQRWLTADLFETNVCWAKKKGRKPYHFIPIHRIIRITFGHSKLLRARASKSPPWRCLSIRTMGSERTFDFVCTNDIDALYFVHGLRYLCSTKSDSKIPKVSLGSMLWERARMRLRAKAHEEKITPATALKKLFKTL